jgi:hypothetical protein
MFANPSFISDEQTYRCIRNHWGLGLVALFFHGVLDPFVTYLSIVVFGVGVEANPFMDYYLRQGPVEFAVIHLPLFGLVLIGLLTFTALYLRAESPEVERLYIISLIIWVGIIVWGAIIVVHNLLVLINGLS